MAGHLVAAKEAAEMLGVTRSRFGQLLDAYDDFPEPEDTLAVGRIWRRADVEAWARKHGRSVTPPAPNGS